jgi:NAD+ kinase
MKIALYSRPEIGPRPEELAEFLNELDRNGLAWCAEEEFARLITEQTGRSLPPGRIYAAAPPPDTGMIVSFGGDGTFLDTVRLLDTRPVPVLGINYGRLGFLANVSRQGMADAVRQIAQGRYSSEERALLEVAGDFGRPVDYPYAFNEFSLQKNGPGMVSVSVSIDGEEVTTGLGDGLLICTPTGSTAYALSLGGPILAPDCRCLEIAPIAPHNLTMRPLIVPDSSEVRLKVLSRTGSALVTLDSRAWPIASGSEFTVKKAKKSAFLVKFDTISFYRTLRDKMMWGLDSREISK